MDYAPQAIDIDTDALEAPHEEYTRATCRQRRPMKLFTKVWVKRASALRRPRKAHPVYRIEPQPALEPITSDGPTQVFRRSKSGTVHENNLLQRRQQ